MCSKVQRAITELRSQLTIIHQYDVVVTDVTPPNHTITTALAEVTMRGTNDLPTVRYQAVLHHAVVLVKELHGVDLSVITKWGPEEDHIHQPDTNKFGITPAPPDDMVMESDEEDDRQQANCQQVDHQLILTKKWDTNTIPTTSTRAEPTDPMIEFGKFLIRLKNEVMLYKKDGEMVATSDTNEISRARFPPAEPVSDTIGTSHSTTNTEAAAPEMNQIGNQKKTIYDGAMYTSTEEDDSDDSKSHTTNEEEVDSDILWEDDEPTNATDKLSIKCYGIGDYRCYQKNYKDRRRIVFNWRLSRWLPTNDDHTSMKKWADPEDERVFQKWIDQHQEQLKAEADRLWHTKDAQLLEWQHTKYPLDAMDISGYNSVMQMWDGFIARRRVFYDHSTNQFLPYDWEKDEFRPWHQAHQAEEFKKFLEKKKRLDTTMKLTPTMPPAADDQHMDTHANGNSQQAESSHQWIKTSPHNSNTNIARDQHHRSHQNYEDLMFINFAGDHRHRSHTATIHRSPELAATNKMSAIIHQMDSEASRHQATNTMPVKKRSQRKKQSQLQKEAREKKINKNTMAASRPEKSRTATRAVSAGRAGLFEMDSSNDSHQSDNDEELREN